MFIYFTSDVIIIITEEEGAREDQRDPERKAVQRQTPRLVLWFISNELIIRVNILQAQICINMVLYSIIL